MQIRARVVAGTQDKVDFLFEAVCRVSVEADLIAALVEVAIALDCREVTVGWLVVVRDAIGGVVRGRPAE